MSLNYGCCSLNDKEGESVECIKCKKTFHCDCLFINKCDIDSASWKCPLCHSQSPRMSRKDHTPVRSSTTTTNTMVTRANKRQALSSPTDVPPLKSDDVQRMIKNTIQEQMDGLLSKLGVNMRQLFNTELQSLRDEIRDVKDSMTYMNSQYEEILREHKQNKDVIKNIQQENLQLKAIIDKQNSRISQLEQHSRSNNVEIQCVPEKKDENLIQIVSRVCQVVGGDFGQDNILHCTRVAKINNTSSRPRSIVVQLNSPRTRDYLLAAAIKFNKANPGDKLNTRQLGFAGESRPIFVTEHLSPDNKYLHAAARLKSREKGYKFVWVRSGRIFMRKTEESKPLVIKSMACLDKLQ